MARFLRKMDRKAGLPPGSLVFTGQRKVETPQLRAITYDVENMVDNILPEHRTLNRDDPGSVIWLNVAGVHDSALISAIGEDFNLSPMVLEDILDTGQRPMLEEFQAHLIVTMKVVELDDSEGRMKTDQVSFVLGKNFLVTFLEQPVSVFDPVYKRLARKKGRIRERGPDYLLYALMDCLLEQYVAVTAMLGERIEEMEEEVINEPVSELLEEISYYRREIAYMRKAVRPVREIVSKLLKEDFDLVDESSLVYFRDFSGLADQVMDSLDIYKEMLSDYFSTYNMSIGTRLNETMMFLTVFATIFIPLTFLAGIYGMNFEVMPELHYKYGYYVLLAVMLLVALVMLYYFRKKKWL